LAALKATISIVYRPSLCTLYTYYRLDFIARYMNKHDRDLGGLTIYLIVFRQYFYLFNF